MKHEEQIKQALKGCYEQIKAAIETGKANREKIMARSNIASRDVFLLLRKFGGVDAPQTNPPAPIARIEVQEPEVNPIEDEKPRALLADNAPEPRKRRGRKAKEGEDGN